MTSELFILAERETPVRGMDAWYLKTYLDAGHRTYPTAEEAEEGRQAGDAYDDPKFTRVVGFRAKAFLPKKKGKRK